MIATFVKAALAEDVGRGDLYALVEPAVPASAKIIAKSDGIVAGREYIDVLAKIENFSIEWLKSDKESFVNGETIATLASDSHTLLRCERTVLDMLLHASSIATLTRKYVDILAPYNVKLLDTRKTRPGLRIFEKYAVRCGGGNNHRMGLDDCLMLKDTHQETIKNLKEFIDGARNKLPYTTKIEIECSTLSAAQEAMDCRVDMIMCDNMSVEEIKKVVACRDEKAPHVLIEASGNITDETIAVYAKSGVDAISSGSLIHQAVWLDFSMKIVHQE